MKKILLFSIIIAMFLNTQMAVCAQEEQKNGTESGYETANEAAEAYISGFIHQDMEEILSACAIETYVDHFDLAKQVERLQYISAANFPYLPVQGDFSRQLDIEIRRNALTQMARYQFLRFNGSRIMDDDVFGMPITLKDHPSAEALVEELYSSEEPEIVFDGTFISPLVLSNNFYMFPNQRNRYYTAQADNAEAFTSVAALLSVDGEAWVMTLGVERFDGKWYVTQNNSLSSILGLSMISGGVFPADLDNLSGIAREYLSDEAFRAALDHVSEIVEGLDAAETFTMPKEEGPAAYQEAVLNALREGLAPEETALMEKIAGLGLN